MTPAVTAQNHRSAALVAGLIVLAGVWLVPFLFVA